MKPARVSLALLLATLAAAPAWAQQANLYERVDLTGVSSTKLVLRMTQTRGEPLATTGALPLPEALAAGGLQQTARQTMVWAVHPGTGLGVGFGVEQRALQREGSMLMGVSLDTGERSQLTLQTPLTASTSRLVPVAPVEEPRQLRMGLVFHTSNQFADLRKGLRMELSGQTTLAFKPRGGRVGFTLQKTW